MRKLTGCNKHGNPWTLIGKMIFTNHEFIACDPPRYALAVAPGLVSHLAPHPTLHPTLWPTGTDFCDAVLQCVVDQKVVFVWILGISLQSHILSYKNRSIIYNFKTKYFPSKILILTLKMVLGSKSILMSLRQTKQCIIHCWLILNSLICSLSIDEDCNHCLLAISAVVLP